jgi:hypothetical protein
MTYSYLQQRKEITDDDNRIAAHSGSSFLHSGSPKLQVQNESAGVVFTTAPEGSLVGR